MSTAVIMANNAVQNANMVMNAGARCGDIEIPAWVGVTMLVVFVILIALLIWDLVT